MKNFVSKNWMGKNLVLLSWGLLLLALSSLWLNIFGELLKGSVDLPVPTATTELVDVDLNTVANEKSILINKIAAYPDYDTKFFMIECKQKKCLSIKK